MRKAIHSGIVRSWFFIRYTDPEPHLRIRFRHSGCAGDLLSMLEHDCARLLEERLLWRVEYSTYEREVERYGGPVAIELVEELFHADSEFAVTLLESDHGLARDLVALFGVATLLKDFGFDERAQIGLLDRGQTASNTVRAHAAAYRERRTTIEAVMAMVENPNMGASHPLVRACSRRSERVQHIAQHLTRLDNSACLTAPVDDIAMSLTHMFVNRLVAHEQRNVEERCYDHLVRYNRSSIERRMREP